MDIKSTEITEGFYIVNTSCGHNLQICFDQTEDGESFERSISGDGSFDMGKCGAANCKALEKYGYYTLLEFILYAAKQDGITVT